MALDIDALVAPLSDDQPSGPDLYGDINRQMIEQAFARSISDGTSSQNSASQWQEAIDLILAQSTQTRDLWLPVYLMRAAVNVGDFDLVCDAAAFLAALTEVRWPDVHPQLEDIGFLGRTTPCQSLTRIGDFLGPLERMPLITHSRLGSFSAADVERFAAKGPKAEGFGVFRTVVDALGEGAVEQVLSKVGHLEDAIRRVDAVLTENAGDESSTNFKPTYELLAKMKKGLSKFAEKAPEAEVEVPAGQHREETVVATARPAPSGAGFSGDIDSREDVARALDAICEYYARCEPGSPIPFVLRRARDWISLDFMAILEDISPGSLGEAMTVLKGRREEALEAGSWGSVESSETGETGEWSSQEDAGGWD